MDKPKLLPPTLRTNERYIIFNVLSESPIAYKDLVKSIWFSCLSFLGELKMSECELWVIRNLYNQKTQRGVIRCRHDMTEYVRTSLALIKQVGNINVIIKVIGVTGTIKSAKRKYLDFTDLKDFEVD